MREFVQYVHYNSRKYYFSLQYVSYNLNPKLYIDMYYNSTYTIDKLNIYYTFIYYL